MKLLGIEVGRWTVAVSPQARKMIERKLQRSGADEVNGIFSLAQMIAADGVESLPRGLRKKVYGNKLLQATFGDLRVLYRRLPNGIFVIFSAFWKTGKKKQDNRMQSAYNEYLDACGDAALEFYEEDDDG